MKTRRKVSRRETRREFGRTVVRGHVLNRPRSPLRMMRGGIRL